MAGSVDVPDSSLRSPGTDWAEAVFALFKAYCVSVVPFVPDGAHMHLIQRCVDDPEIRAVTLTTEEEGVALAAGAFLGGQRAAILMQSSGVGNCVNMLSLPAACNMPLVMIVTMRGEWGEFNPWQVPMGQSTPAVLEASGVIVYRVDSVDQVVATVEGALTLAFSTRRQVAVLLSQRLLGAKNFARGDK
jgi:sulfopyruvate decarboxylase alpha subunit